MKNAPNSIVSLGGLGLAIATASMLAFGAPVLAQDNTVGEVTVTAPLHVGRSATTGAPIEVMTRSEKINYVDLDLRTDQGVATLNQRVVASAGRLCEALEAQYPLGTPDDFACRKAAVADAHDQVQDAIALARRPPPPPATEPAYTPPPPAAAEPAYTPPPPARKAGERG